MTVFRRIVFPHLLPALLSGVALAFARAIGEFGAVMLIAGNIPFKTEVASLYVFQHINSDDPTGSVRARHPHARDLVRPSPRHRRHAPLGHAP